MSTQPMTFEHTIGKAGLGSSIREMLARAFGRQQVLPQVEDMQALAQVGRCDAVVERVIRCVTEVLDVDPTLVRGEMRLFGELGACNLDVEGLVYLLEEEFDVELTRSELSPAARLELPADAIFDHGRLTADALALLRRSRPEQAPLLVDGLSRADLLRLITVEDVARVVKDKLQLFCP